MSSQIAEDFKLLSFFVFTGVNLVRFTCVVEG